MKTLFSMHKTSISILYCLKDKTETLFLLWQIQLKDLLRTGNVKSSSLKGNSLMELMKLKPPPDITTPVATATATGQLLSRHIETPPPHMDYGIR